MNSLLFKSIIFMVYLTIIRCTPSDRLKHPTSIYQPHDSSSYPDYHKYCCYPDFCKFPWCKRSYEQIITTNEQLYPCSYPYDQGQYPDEHYHNNKPWNYPSKGHNHKHDSTTNINITPVNVQENQQEIQTQIPRTPIVYPDPRNINHNNDNTNIDIINYQNQNQYQNNMQQPPVYNPPQKLHHRNNYPYNKHLPIINNNNNYVDRYEEDGYPIPNPKPYQPPRQKFRPYPPYVPPVYYEPNLQSTNEKNNNVTENKQITNDENNQIINQNETTIVKTEINSD